jgi:hypothetical protein
MAGYLGAIPVPQATQHRESFTATSGQTTFNTAGYTVGFLDVYLNGSHLSPAAFTATNGSDVVLASAASADDVCDIISYTAFEVNAQTFTGTTTMDVAAITGALDVGGTITSDGLTVQNVNDTTTNTAEFRNDNGNRTFRFAQSTSGDADLLLEKNDGTDTVLISTHGDSYFNGGNVGIGGAPSSLLHLEDDTPIITLRDTSAYSAGTGPYIQFQGLDSGSTNRVFGQIYGISNGSNSGELAFYTRNSGSTAERMRIDSSGNLLVGTTSSSGSGDGIVLGANDQVIATRDGAAPLWLNRRSDDGAIALFNNDGTTRGSIGITSNVVQYSGTVHASFGAGDVGLYVNSDNDALYPVNQSTLGGRDGVIDLGLSTNRFDDIYATNGTIQTSDRNEKQDIASLTATEMLVAKRISALFKTFRWRDKVAAKGNDARTHTGIIAQDVQAAFAAESLDAGDYSLFISSTWWEHDVEVHAVEAVAEVTEDVVIAAVEEELDEEGNVVVEAQEERTEQRVTTEAVEAVDAYTRTDTYDTQSEAPAGATSKTRMGIRYPELLSFVAAYNEQRFAAIETRLTALEAV